jgi:hypothetical protein
MSNKKAASFFFHPNYSSGFQYQKITEQHYPVIRSNELQTTTQKQKKGKRKQHKFMAPIIQAS